LIPAVSFRQGVKKQNPKGETARAPDKLLLDPFSAEVPSSAAHAPRREHMLVQIHATPPLPDRLVSRFSTERTEWAT
jgi:hypothetical protein